MTDDRTTFERQLGAVFAAYADRAPTDVDLRVVAEAARQVAAPSSLELADAGRRRALSVVSPCSGRAADARHGRRCRRLVGSRLQDDFTTTRVDPTLAPHRAYEGVFVLDGPIGSSSEAGDALATSNLVRLSDGRVLCWVTAGRIVGHRPCGIR